ncbi:Receptor-like protein 34 [Linum perenne]
MKQATPPGSQTEVINLTHYIQYPGIAYKSYYQDSVTVTAKGIEREYDKILTSFVLIDVSNNIFTGEIPEAIASLESIHLLNLSNNHFTGHIPVSFGQLSQLESLDLSSNNLSGNIPPQLTKLTFMSKLNLSHNSLTREIPRGFQFENFEPDSYEGNPGLCWNLRFDLPSTESEDFPETEFLLTIHDVSSCTQIGKGDHMIT